jgi:hypothetical protein
LIRTLLDAVKAIFLTPLDSQFAPSPTKESIMTSPTVVPYGSWKSPITAELIASGTIAVGQIALAGDDVYWIETCPAEGGRNVIVRWTADGGPHDLTPPPFNAPTRVHEYGGGAFVVSGRTVYCVNFSDQRIYRQQGEEAPQAITVNGGRRYADGVLDLLRNRLICVREDHSMAGREPDNCLAAVLLDGQGAENDLASGNDFYSSPRLSPDDNVLAWLPPRLYCPLYHPESNGVIRPPPSPTASVSGQRPRTICR